MALNKNQLRNIIFGAEDSFVSTTGFLFGLASNPLYSKTQIILAGIMLLTVEALSMGVGSFLSEKSTEEIEQDASVNPMIDGVLMFFSYFLSGIVILAPYQLMNPAEGRYASLAAALICLFLLGYLPLRKVNSGIRMMSIAGVAAMVGYLVSRAFETLQ